MRRVLPSHIVQAVNQLFGTRNEIYSNDLSSKYCVEVEALLSLIDDIPSELIDLISQDYLEFQRCYAALTITLAFWKSGNGIMAPGVGSKDPVERIRRLMMQCSDERPPDKPELPFITDEAARRGIEERIRSAWIDFSAGDWMGATVFGGAAIETLLLWAIGAWTPSASHKKPIEQLDLSGLIEAAHAHGLIRNETVQQAHLARDARNLVHPGRALRTGSECTKGTALAALAGIYRIVEDLSAYQSKSEG
jgi:hypothetical protein